MVGESQRFSTTLSSFFAQCGKSSTSYPIPAYRALQRDLQACYESFSLTPKENPPGSHLPLSIKFCPGETN